METFLRVAIGLVAAAVLVWLVVKVIRQEGVGAGSVFTSSEPEPRPDEGERKDRNRR